MFYALIKHGFLTNESTFRALSIFQCQIKRVVHYGFVSVYTPARALTSEEVQAKLAAHADELKKKAQQTASLLNVPGYINPSVVNPHQFAMQAQKRKLLWSGKKAEVIMTCFTITIRAVFTGASFGYSP